LHADGSLDDGFNTLIHGQVNGLVLQPDGRILVGVSLVLPDGSPGAYLRLEADGSIDSSFHPMVSASRIYCLALQADGKILVHGLFTFPGQPTGHWFGRLLDD